MIELPRKQGDLYTVTQEDYATYVKTYPQLNVKAELQKMKLWLDNNPAKRKSDCGRFITGWLNRAKPSPHGSVETGASGNQALVYERENPDKPHVRASDAVVQAELQKMRRALGMRPEEVKE